MRTRGEPSEMTAAIRREVLAVDPEQPIYSVSTMEEVVAAHVSRDRFSALLFGAFAGLSLMLAVAGVFGVISYAVNQRTREMGVRMALGARREDVLRLVLGGGVSLAAIGVVAGLGLSLWLGQYLESQLFETEASDPIVFAAVAVALTVAAAAAAYIPARRATKADPMSALRYE